MRARSRVSVPRRPDERAGVLGEPVGEQRQLPGLQLLVAFVQLARELGHALLEPPALGLERERVRVAVGQRPLEAREAGRLFGRLGEQLVDLLEQCGDRFGCQQPLLDYRRGMPPANKGRAAYPRERRGPDLTAVTALRTMPRMTRRRLPVVAVVLALVLAAPAGAGDSPLAKRLARALAVPHVSPARTGAVAIDLQTGETVFSEHDALPLAPASNEKLAVTYGALVALGPTFRIETDVLGRGEQDGTTWRGSLVLVGHGDPTLSSADLAALARQVRAAGIRTRDGRRLRRRVVLRRPPHRRRLEVVVLRERVAAALGADRRPRPLPRPHLARPGARGRAALPRRAAPRRRRGRPARATARSATTTCRSPRSTRRRSRRSSPGWTATATTSRPRCCSSSSAPPAARSARARGGAEIVRGALADAGVPLGGRAARSTAPASRSLDRLTARALVGTAAGRLGRPRRPPVPASPRCRSPAVSGTLADRMRTPARARQRAREDRHDDRSPRRSPATSSAATSSRSCRTAARSRRTGRGARRTASRPR